METFVEMIRSRATVSPLAFAMVSKRKGWRRPQSFH